MLDGQAGDTRSSTAIDYQTGIPISAKNGQMSGTRTHQANIIADHKTAGVDVGDEPRHGKGDDIAVFGRGQDCPQRARAVVGLIGHNQRRSARWKTNQRQTAEKHKQTKPEVVS